MLTLQERFFICLFECDSVRQQFPPFTSGYHTDARRRRREKKKADNPLSEKSCDRYDVLSLSAQRLQGGAMIITEVMRGGARHLVSREEGSRKF